MAQAATTECPHRPLIPRISIATHMAADRSLRTAVSLIATVAIFAALYFASAIFAPVAFALLIIAIVWPLQSRLQSLLPRLIALAIVIVITVVVFLAFASLVAWSFGRVGRWVVANAAQFQLLYEQATVWLDSYGIAVAGLWAEHFNVRWLVRAFQGITGRVNTTMSFWLVVLVYVILGLLEVDDVGRKIRALENREAARVLLDGSVATAIKFRKYMLVRTLMSVITGVLVWAFATFAGVQLAVEWGIIAFALNYIPFIGPFIATASSSWAAISSRASPERR
jgi:AI-2 transport protein TqsA